MARDDLPTALAGVYSLALVAVALVRWATGHPTPAEFAATPAAIASGKLWVLVTSALLVNGPAALELAGLIAAAVVLIHRHGGAMFWLVAIVSHFGSTLVTYAGVGLLWLADHGAVEDVLERPDYGISAAWMGLLGALFASSWRSLGRGSDAWVERALFGVCLVAAIVSFAFFPLLAGTEHVLAFALGAAVLFHRAPAAARPRGVSAQSAT
jgi:hypothetical protein